MGKNGPMTIDTENLDRQVAELLGHVYDPVVDRYTTDGDAADELLAWLGSRGVAAAVEGSAVSLICRGWRQTAVAGDTSMVALAKAVLKLARDRPELLARR